MAQYYDVIGQKDDVRVLGETAAVPVELVTIRTKPSSVLLSVPVPIADWQGGTSATYLEPPALLIEQLMGNDTGSGTTGGTYVDQAAYIQDTDQSGLLAGFVRLRVYYNPPGGIGLPMTASVVLPFTSFESFAAFEQPIGGHTPSDIIIATHAQLVRTAGL